MITIDKIIEYLKSKITDVKLGYYKPRQPMNSFNRSFVKHILIEIDNEWYILDNIDYSLLEYIEDRFGEISHDDYKLIEVNIRNLLPKE